MMMTEAAPRDDEPGEDERAAEGTSATMRMERPARATVFRRNRGAAGGEDNAATSIGVPAMYRIRPEAGRYWTPTRRPLRRASGEEEVMPGMRVASLSRGRWWRRRPAHGKRDSGGRRWNSGGNATVLPARTRLRCFPRETEG
uniref:Uncharacterized protein n=1 Tax=Oryza sativa subsp. japonica TaxID=39947 RepID=Q2QUW4_ORYSJ|nr:hypothetical protein LOC_Os12g14870 [Oryza sativa Japonica Group]